VACFVGVLSVFSAYLLCPLSRASSDPRRGSDRGRGRNDFVGRQWFCR
jgi:hypothetical protein